MSHDANSSRAADGRSQRGLWLFAAVSLGLFLLLAVAVYVEQQAYFSWDLTLSKSIQARASPWAETLMRIISLAGDNVLWSSCLIAGACLILLRTCGRREAAVLLGVILVAQVLKIAAKLIVGRPRPTDNLVEVLIKAHEVNSFPSGHTVHYTVFCGFLMYVTFIRVKVAALRYPLLIVFGALLLTVGLSRIYLGAHWISDIIGGYLLGGAVLAGGIAVNRRGGT